MKKGIILIISGPSGGGKGTVVKKLREMRPDIGFSVSATTRAPRDGEREGVDYFYITHSQFEEKLGNGEILEHTEYCGNYYGTPRSEVERVVDSGLDIILEIEVEGASQIKKLYPDAVTVMLIPPSLSELKKRLEGRNSEDRDAVCKRLARAAEEIDAAQSYDYVVVNGNNGVDECANKISAIIEAEHLKSSRMTEEVNNFNDIN